MPDTILVAMSGGVDSSVAAALLLEQGYDVIGITLQLWGKDVCTSAGSRRCCSVRDTLDAKAVAKRLGIRHEVLDLADEFRTHVIDYFVGSYEKGLTPNPCIACNTHIKFGSFYDRADELGAAWIATGHYAQLRKDVQTGRTQLFRAADAHKDQSYVLFDLSQAQLSRSLFPLGGFVKEDARRVARAYGFVNADKPDSQDICFIQNHDTAGFLKSRLGTLGEPGPIVDTSGKELGTHRGLLSYTVGQREGLGLAVGKPIYVVAIDQAQNRLVVGERSDILGRHLGVERVNWVSIAQPTAPIRARVKIRSRHEPAAADIRPSADGREATIIFDEPQPAITPGQAAVFYDGDRVLGGGWIKPDAPLLPAPEAANGHGHATG